MTKPTHFKTKTAGDLPLPVFFPDATRAVIKVLDSEDIRKTKTPGVLVNTYHLYKDLGKSVIKEHGTIREFMDWQGGIISDSGGFQVMSLVKSPGYKGKITDQGVTFQAPGQPKVHLTPEESIAFQMVLSPDMVVVLDDFTPPTATYEEAQETVSRTLLWAKRSKAEFEKICQEKKIAPQDRPYLLGVVQGGKYQDLRKYCTENLVKIGFDGLGYGGWPITQEGNFDYESARTIVENAPEDYFFYGLGIGKPQEIVALSDMGYTIFDCVLPTRDARHKRLYVFNARSKDEIDIRKENFYSYFVPNKEKYYHDTQPVSPACDCLLCTHYTRSYLAHLFRNDDPTAGRLATIHNLRFYSLLMEKLRNQG
jgi:queuine tRNA-ribosyltransferase